MGFAWLSFYQYCYHASDIEQIAFASVPDTHQGPMSANQTLTAFFAGIPQLDVLAGMECLDRIT
jgi:hypothetical protein